MTSLKTTAAAAVLAGALALCASSALARAPLTTVHCGQTLTTSVRLANDLTDCPGDGLVAGADGITVDLDGHTIDGVASTACDRPDAPSHGIADAGNDGVTIENGTVRQFDFGVSAGSATDGLSNGRIHHMTLVDDTFGGVSLGTGGGAALMAGDRIDHNVVSGSACGDGLKLNGGRDDRFTDNRVAGSDTGITICCSVNDVDNVVQGNAVSDSGSLGILLFSSASDDLVGNRIDGSGDTGILVNGQTSDDLVKGNVIDHTQETGLLARAVLWRQPGRAERGAHRGERPDGDGRRHHRDPERRERGLAQHRPRHRDVRRPGGLRGRSAHRCRQTRTRGRQHAGERSRPRRDGRRAA